MNNINPINSQTNIVSIRNTAQDTNNLSSPPIRENTPQIRFAQSNITSQIINEPATTLVTEEEKLKYNTILSELKNKKDRKKIIEMLRTGRLLDKKNSNDHSTVLDNLYKIVTTPRAKGLDKQVVLEETVNAIYNPFVITQKFGDIPRKLQKPIIDNENDYVKKHLQSSTDTNQQSNLKLISAKDLDIKSNCCVAASIEFNIAHRMPAEFARMVEQLTSESMTVTKVIDIKSIASNYVDSMTLLENFNPEHEYFNNNQVKLKLKPDRNAIVRARIQNSYKDSGERSLVDVLMQSMLMNLGSAQTYNSLTDTRCGQFDKGLANVEKTFVECLVTGKNNILVNYQIIDNDMKLTGYECSFAEMKKHITDSLNSGNNVIIGYTYLEENGKINPDGHEITIVGIERDKNGKEFFICKDTDNSFNSIIKYEVNEFLPQIHHAGIPRKVLENNDVEFVENWQLVLNALKDQNAQTANI